jgi:hypothetical protein
MRGAAQRRGGTVTTRNRQVILIAQPAGIPQAGHFALPESPVPSAR